MISTAAFLLSFLAGLFAARALAVWRVWRLHRCDYRPATFRDTNIHRLDIEL